MPCLQRNGNCYEEKIQTRVGSGLRPDPPPLGPTLMHEHLLIDLVPPRLAEDADRDDVEIRPACKLLENHGITGSKPSLKNYRLDQVDVAIEEVTEMQAAGGQSIVDLT